MKLQLKAKLLVAVVLILLLLTTSLVLAAPNPFIGKWYSTDPFDDSQQWMAIGGGNDRHPVIGFDKGATVCAGDAGELYPARIKGWGSIDGLTFTADVDVWCQTGPQKGFWGSILMEFQYDPGTGTLSDLSGAEWHH